MSQSQLISMSRGCRIKHVKVNGDYSDNTMAKQELGRKDNRAILRSKQQELVELVEKRRRLEHAWSTVLFKVVEQFVKCW